MSNLLLLLSNAFFFSSQTLYLSALEDQTGSTLHAPYFSAYSCFPPPSWLFGEYNVSFNALVCLIYYLCYFWICSYWLIFLLICGSRLPASLHAWYFFIEMLLGVSFFVFFLRSNPLFLKLVVCSLVIWKQCDDAFHLLLPFVRQDYSSL